MMIDIIGGGIAGLTTAIALERKGIKTRIFEQAQQLKPVGAGIILANNAMQVYDKLGLRKAIEQRGNPISAMHISTSNLEPLSSIDLKYFEQKNNIKNIAIHRGTLQQILLDALQSSEIKLSHSLHSIVKDQTEYNLAFDNKATFKSSLVIAADGLNSRIRQQLFNTTHIRKANQICWRGVANYELPLNYRAELIEAWGKSERFGFVQIDKNKVYWYALKSAKQVAKEEQVESITSYFKDYDKIVVELIQSTKVEHIHQAEIADLKPNFDWCKDNLCLIGDAAHAATPNMGQGACQAIEDAYVLAECLDKYSPQQAFEKYQRLRLAKAHQVVKMSWLIGKMAHLRNPLLRFLRNEMLKRTPASVSRKRNEQIFQLAQI